MHKTYIYVVDKTMPKESRQAEREFLAAYDPAVFERPSITVDVALLSVIDGAIWTLLVRRAEHPFKGRLALPGGFVRMDESLDDAAARVLSGKAGIEPPYLEQLYTFGEPKRDPRMRIVTVTYYALVDAERFRARKAEPGATVVARLVVPWKGETGGPVRVVDAQGKAHPLAFDHADILGMAVKRVRGKLDYSPLGFQLLPERFTLLDLQKVHEALLGRPLNKDSFRRRMLASGQLEATGKSRGGTAFRPAELYRFSKRSAV